MNETCSINVTLNGEAKLPHYSSSQAAGADLCAYLPEGNLIIKPMERVLVPTGICIELPIGFEAQIRPRSGLAIKNGITVLNSPGTIDSDYRGEIKIILINLSNEDFIINNGDRIAQMVISKHETASFKIQTTLKESIRGEGGFGSTGVK